MGGQGAGYAWSALGGAGSQLEQLVLDSYICAVIAMKCCIALVAKLHLAMYAAAVWHTMTTVEDDRGWAETEAEAASPWRHLQLHEVQLMELLAAGMELHKAAAATRLLLSCRGRRAYTYSCAARWNLP